MSHTEAQGHGEGGEGKIMEGKMISGCMILPSIILLILPLCASVPLCEIY